MVQVHEEERIPPKGTSNSHHMESNVVKQKNQNGAASTSSSDKDQRNSSTSSSVRRGGGGSCSTARGGRYSSKGKRYSTSNSRYNSPWLSIGPFSESTSPTRGGGKGRRGHSPKSPSHTGNSQPGPSSSSDPSSQSDQQKPDNAITDSYLNQPHCVFLHVNQGEAISFQMGDGHVQFIQGKFIHF